MNDHEPIQMNERLSLRARVRSAGLVVGGARLGVALSALCWAGCPLDQPQNVPNADLAVIVDVPKVTVSAPARTPESTVALRGRAEHSSRVVFLWEPGHVQSTQALLLSGEFCVDLPLAPNVLTTFHVYAQGNGLTSEAVDVNVQQDPAAAKPTDSSCSNVTPCMSMGAEVCNNGRDDTCDGLADGCDPQCRGGQRCEDSGQVCGSGDTCVCDVRFCNQRSTHTICCPNQVTCNDLYTDEKNCGACGHRCSTGRTCVNGICT